MTSRYPEIKKYIMQKINENAYKEGEMLPPERELTELFKVSRMTVRRALDELISDGVLIRKKGSGVIVAYTKQMRTHDKVSFQTDKELIEKYGSINTKVISLEIINDHFLANKYFGDCINNEDVYLLKRVQYGKNIPLVYEKIFFRKKYFKDLLQLDCTQSMSAILGQTLLIDINNELVEIDAKIASKKLASILQVSIGSAILQITNVQKNNDKVIYFGVNSINGDLFNYVQMNQR